MSELIAACRELSKHLRTENDPKPSEDEVLRLMLRTKPQVYRDAAAEIEARDAAIERFRKALAEVA